MLLSASLDLATVEAHASFVMSMTIIVESYHGVVIEGIKLQTTTTKLNVSMRAGLNCKISARSSFLDIMEFRNSHITSIVVR